MITDSQAQKRAEQLNANNNKTAGIIMGNPLAKAYRIIEARPMPTMTSMLCKTIVEGIIADGSFSIGVVEEIQSFFISLADTNVVYTVSNLTDKGEDLICIDQDLDMAICEGARNIFDDFYDEVIDNISRKGFFKESGIIVRRVSYFNYEHNMKKTYAQPVDQNRTWSMGIETGSPSP